MKKVQTVGRIEKGVMSGIEIKRLKGQVGACHSRRTLQIELHIAAGALRSRR